MAGCWGVLLRVGAQHDISSRREVCMGLEAIIPGQLTRVLLMIEVVLIGLI